jgi:hypothetical protein
LTLSRERSLKTGFLFFADNMIIFAVNYRQLEAGGLQFQVSYSRPEETSENGLLRAG